MKQKQNDEFLTHGDLAVVKISLENFGKQSLDERQRKEKRLK